MGLVGLSAIFIGFSKTFFIPVAENNFNAPFSIYFHALLSFLWVLLFTFQAYLIKINKHKLHLKLGVAGLLIAVGAALTLAPVAKFVIVRDLNNGLGETAYSMGVGLLTTGIIFLLLVALGLLYCKKVQFHKRFLLLATIVLLWPAWFRFRHFFPEIPRPDIWFGVVLADSLIIITWIWDKVNNGKVHHVLLYFGIAIILEQSFEVIMFDSPLWRLTGKFIYNIF